MGKLLKEKFVGVTSSIGLQLDCVREKKDGDGETYYEADVHLYLVGENTIVQCSKTLTLEQFGDGVEFELNCDVKLDVGIDLKSPEKVELL